MVLAWFCHSFNLFYSNFEILPTSLNNIKTPISTHAQLSTNFLTNQAPTLKHLPNSYFIVTVMNVMNSKLLYVDFIMNVRKFT